LVSAIAGGTGWFYWGGWANGITLFEETSAGSAEFDSLYWFDEAPIAGPKNLLNNWLVVDDAGIIHYGGYDGWGVAYYYKSSEDGGATFSEVACIREGREGFQSANFETHSDPYGASLQAYVDEGAGDYRVSWAIVDQGNNLFVVESPDGGISWDSTMVMNATDYEGWGTDSIVRPSQYCDGLYDGEGNLHVLFDAQYYLDTSQTDARHPYPGNGPDQPYLADYKPRIQHWSEAKGVSNVAISPYPSSDLGAAYASMAGRGTASLSYNPKIGLDKETGMMYAAWTQFNENEGGMDGESFVGYGDVYMAVSQDSGSTWTRAKNVTATPNFDERDADMAQNIVDGKVHLLYTGDNVAGYQWSGTRTGIFHHVVGEPVITNVEEENDVAVANEFKLEQNYPNPFNPTTHINFQLPKHTNVTLTIYNILGQKIKTLVDKNMTSGVHSAIWNGTNEYGVSVSSGVYIYRLKTADGHTQVRKMLLQK
ncbi:MAG: T9SS type A sorting domain-containing protein, partial [Candidatus Marinimicrobia bacterium]|nr:T9SS type A sorting domain-containing protein [Candidatus Neomarinimicrobiota bacterium]